MIEVAQDNLKTLTRQYKITLRRIDNIEKQLAQGPVVEHPPREETLVDWFLGLLGLQRVRRDGAERG